MNIELIIYLASLSGDLKFILIALALISLFGVVMYSTECSAGEFKKRFLMIPAILLLLFVVIPNKSTIYAITATHLTKEMKIDGTVKKALKLLDSKIDELLEEKTK